MDCNANHHGFETPDALPQHRDRNQDTMRTDSLLRDTLTRVEDMSQQRDTPKDDDRRFTRRADDYGEMLAL